MDRRGFLGSILALGAAPAIVRADALMRVVPLDTTLVWDIAPLDTVFIDNIKPLVLTEADLHAMMMQVFAIPQQDVIPVSVQTYEIFQRAWK